MHQIPAFSLRVALCLAGWVSLGAMAHVAEQGSAPPSVGVVAFANSGAPAAQSAFARGLALLHNFEYDFARQEFRQAQQADPGFAMAYWGEAMTHNHAIWMEQDLAAARAVLLRLGDNPKARAAKAPTARERDYLAAVEILYGEGSKTERDFRYEQAMGALAARYPRDVDAAAFHALAILGTAHAGRDVATYMRAAAILENFYPDNREHPGVLHYLIHSYDDPQHAPLGLRAARRYGAVAPEAGHALHMTSHIFIALGMWDEVVTANEQAIAVVKRQKSHGGQEHGVCGHYSSWLVYGYLQRREPLKARVWIDACRALALRDLATRKAGSPDPDNSHAGSFVAVRNMAVADSGEWRASDDVPLDNASDWVRFAAAYGELLGANARGSVAALMAPAAQLERLAPVLLGELDRDGNASLAWRAAIEATRLQGQALLGLRQGRDEAGLALLRRAAALEAGAPLEFGPPMVAKPSAELLGDELLRLGRKAEAAAAYRATLARAPGRRLAVAGLARAEA